MFDKLKRKWHEFNISVDDNYKDQFSTANADAEDVVTFDGYHYKTKMDHDKESEKDRPSILDETLDEETNINDLTVDHIKYDVMGQYTENDTISFVLEKIGVYIQYAAKNNLNQLIFIEYGDFTSNETNDLDGDTATQRKIIQILRNNGFTAEHRSIKTQDDLKWIFENIPSRNVAQLNVGGSYLYIDWKN